MHNKEAGNLEYPFVKLKLKLVAREVQGQGIQQVFVKVAN